jgi:hypothetical protein
MVTPAARREFVGMKVHETRHYRSVSVGRVDRLHVGPSSRLPSQAIVFGLVCIPIWVKQVVQLSGGENHLVSSVRVQ